MLFRRSKENKFKIQPDDPVLPGTTFTVSLGGHSFEVYLTCCSR